MQINMRLFFLIFLLPLISLSQADIVGINTATDLTKESAGVPDSMRNHTFLDATQLRYASFLGSGDHSGSSNANEWSLQEAFDNAVAGDFVYVRITGGGGTYDISGLQGTLAQPIHFKGYVSTPEDINVNDSPIVSKEDYTGYAQTDHGTHNLDPFLMPTFTGDSDDAPNYIPNGTAWNFDSSNSYIIIENFQFQYYHIGISFSGVDYVYVKNVVSANNGYFYDIEGQGGFGSDLYGSGFVFEDDSQHAHVNSCASYNQCLRGVTFTDSDWCKVENTTVYSNHDEGNPQDYYIYFRGKNNYVVNCDVYQVEAAALSDHSGHGICFNRYDFSSSIYSENNIAESSTISGTSFHLDGALSCKLDDIQVYRTTELNPRYSGGNLIVKDDPRNHYIKDSYFEGSANFSYDDTHPELDHVGAFGASAGQSISFENTIFKGNGDSYGIYLNWLPVFDVGPKNIEFKDCDFENLEALFYVERPSDNFSFIRGNVIDVENLQYTDDKSFDYILNPNTNFTNVNFWNSEIPTSFYQISGITNTDPDLVDTPILIDFSIREKRLRNPLTRNF